MILQQYNNFVEFIDEDGKRLRVRGAEIKLYSEGPRFRGELPSIILNLGHGIVRKVINETMETMREHLSGVHNQSVSIVNLGKARPDDSYFGEEPAANKSPPAPAQIRAPAKAK